MTDKQPAATLSLTQALVGSFVGSDLSYYPRREATAEKIDSKAMLDEIRASLDAFDFASAELSKTADPKLLLDRAKDSLEEAKKQTEYQDAKAARLLTIVAFLTAAVGTVFGKFIDLYPLHNDAALVSWTSFWVGATYLLFGIYLLLVAAGALVMFHAMSTRFVWPPGGSNLADKNDIVSVLFYQPIIRTKPEAWGKLFAGDQATLMRTYYKNYATEAYLIANKVADKLRYLDPGQRLLNISIRMLLCVFLLIILTFTFVTPPSKVVATSTAGATATTPVTGAAFPPPAVSAPSTPSPAPDKATPAAQPSATASPAATSAASASAPKSFAPAVPKK
ncbi:MAG: hypothetical protein KIT35_28700 [Piscinibacter sp.]|uniref:hypothetical protein n=1 Tax=Piscinibacter sp. TaxID=1903157 RepID=UPI00258F795A|nr:hypothetical protein [Piscinibacter sp.]MCW5667835.1 hypothetical protein [Piscinibacter sp.]